MDVALFMYAVLEIKGAPCAHRARFLKLCTRTVHIFSVFYYTYVLEVCMCKRCTIFEDVRLGWAQKKSFISNTGIMSGESI